MGAGFHGGSGLKAVRNGHVWSTFVVPRLLYGIECQLLKKKENDSLEKFQRKCLKQLQSLPDNTSSSACLALLGIPPIESVIHKSLLNLFATMMRDQKSIEYEIAQRQIVMKDFPDKSMFTHIQCLLDLYDLPSVRFGLATRTQNFEREVFFYYFSNFPLFLFVKLPDFRSRSLGPAISHCWSLFSPKLRV